MQYYKDHGESYSYTWKGTKKGTTTPTHCAKIGGLDLSFLCMECEAKNPMNHAKCTLAMQERSKIDIKHCRQRAFNAKKNKTTCKLTGTENKHGKCKYDPSKCDEHIRR